MGRWAGMTSIYTVGHSNHTWERFRDLLRPHGVDVLVDVRSNPASRHAPFANRRRFPALLEHDGIDYVHLGDALGGKPADRSLYLPDGAPDYRKMGAKPEFLRGVHELVALAGERTVALMCAEEDPAACHRSLRIGPALERRGVTLSPIRKDGALEAAPSA